jgi:hypothetical protein
MKYLEMRLANAAIAASSAQARLMKYLEMRLANAAIAASSAQAGLMKYLVNLYDLGLAANV